MCRVFLELKAESKSHLPESDKSASFFLITEAHYPFFIFIRCKINFQHYSELWYPNSVGSDPTIKLNIVLIHIILSRQDYIDGKFS